MVLQYSHICFRIDQLIVLCHLVKDLWLTFHFGTLDYIVFIFRNVFHGWEGEVHHAFGWWFSWIPSCISYYLATLSTIFSSNFGFPVFLLLHSWSKWPFFWHQKHFSLHFPFFMHVAAPWTPFFSQKTGRLNYSVLLKLERYFRICHILYIKFLEFGSWFLVGKVFKGHTDFPHSRLVHR